MDTAVVSLVAFTVRFKLLYGEDGGGGDNGVDGQGGGDGGEDVKGVEMETIPFTRVLDGIHP